MPDTLVGDCRDLMAQMAPASVDAIVCDPPYGLSFMGKEWDHAVPGAEFWEAALRVAKPGAHLVAFGGTRTFHRLACAIEDAGWEIRDTLSWLYGSGFPKSHNGPWGGTALKPAWEPIILARKPLAGTVAATVAEYGTGGLNVDGCRIGTTKTVPASPKRAGPKATYGDLSRATGETAGYDSTLGRWPANVVLDEDAAAMLDTQTGEIRTQRIEKPSDCAEDGQWGTLQGRRGARGYSDTGGASRFFYCAKASRREREAGLEGMPLGANRINAPRANEGEKFLPSFNHHPTVKPISLMRWLCRLVTPPGGLILDPFTGSGSTGCAAVAEGFRFVGCELNDDYAEIARRRIAHWAPDQRELL